MRPLAQLIAVAATATLLATPACGGSPQDPAATGTATRLPDGVSRFTLPATEFDGIGIHELSGLAWDRDERLLYAVSDQGHVFHFRLGRDGGGLAAVEPVYAAALNDPRGGEGEGFNAEGLAVINAANQTPGDTELVVSLEGKGGPRIIRFSPAGAVRGELPVPPPAGDLDNYRKKGRGLESVALHPQHGLMTAPESPLAGQPEDRHAIYANDGRWSFKRHSADSRLKGFDVLPDGDLLVLERNRAASKQSRVASVRRVDLAACREGETCATAMVVTLPPGPENFEGMNLLDAHRILLVSDDGDKDSHDTTFLLVPLP